ncbi:MAG: hypothetical protein ACTSU6_01410 [Candidatus Njordarchaeales archaeon]
MNKEENFSLDELLIDEEEVRPATILPISIIILEIEFMKPLEDPNYLKKNVKLFLFEKYSFRRRKGRRLKEGFLEFIDIKNAFKCYYAKEVPFKITFEMDDLKIHEKRIRLITHSNSVQAKISFNQKGTKIVIFGSDDYLNQKVLNLINIAIRGFVKDGYRLYESYLSQDDMRKIMSNLESVEYIWIGPGESERFIKLVEKRVGKDIKRIPEYLVHSRMRGIQITRSPFVAELIKEEGIRLREIQGRIKVAGIRITARVSNIGKIIFWIPQHIIPKGSSPFTIAEKFYEDLISEKSTKYKQLLLGEFIK